MVIGAISSAGEHYIDIVGVTGSIPVSPTTNLKRKHRKAVSHEPELSPPEQAIHLASSFYAELTASAAEEEALVDIIEKLEPEARKVNFVTACGLKTNFTTVHEFPLELAEYAEIAIGHLNDVVYCHAALVQILRAQEVEYQFADEIELSHKIEKVVEGVTQELFAILTQEEKGVMINEDVFAKRLLDKLIEEPA